VFVEVVFFLFLLYLDYLVLVVFAFVVLALVSSTLCQEMGWKEHLQNDLFCVELDVKTLIIEHCRLLTM